MLKQTLTIQGMRCSGCANVISKKISKLPGVESFDINLELGKATVSFDSKITTISDMNKEIEENGYSLLDSVGTDKIDIKSV